MSYRLILVGDLGRRVKGCISNRTKGFRDRLGRTRERFSGLRARVRPYARQRARSYVEGELDLSFSVPLSRVFDGLYETHCGWGDYRTKGKS